MVAWDTIQYDPRFSTFPLHPDAKHQHAVIREVRIVAMQRDDGRHKRLSGARAAAFRFRAS